MTDLLTWGVFGLLVLLPLLAGVFWFRGRMERLRYEEELAELEFQESILTDVSGGSLREDSRFLVPSAEAVVRDDPAGAIGAENPPDMLPRPQGLLDGAGDERPADALAAGVMRQLTATGLLASVDGYVPLHGNPKGVALLKFRNGKQALLVPHMESEAFLRQNARRADFIIMTGADGKAVVVTPLEQFLAESVSGIG